MRWEKTLAASAMSASLFASLAPADPPRMEFEFSSDQLQNDLAGLSIGISIVSVSVNLTKLTRS